MALSLSPTLKKNNWVSSTFKIWDLGEATRKRRTFIISVCHYHASTEIINSKDERANPLATVELTGEP